MQVIGQANETLSKLYEEEEMHRNRFYQDFGRCAQRGTDRRTLSPPPGLTGLPLGLPGTSLPHSARSYRRPQSASGLSQMFRCGVD
jgi:hypothetical protein